ncbi:hypothetical protein DFH28DRAFT_934403 [Melampsora americana]|nr:hypothetical protein DFH28DRAFT_934403 [Melampsora americana]
MNLRLKQQKTQTTFLKAATFINLNEFSVCVHDKIVGVAVLDLRAKVPKAESQHLKDNLKKMKKKLEGAGFGSFLVTKDDRNLAVGNCMALLSAAEKIQKAVDIGVSEGRLAMCIAYDTSYYWADQVLCTSCGYLPAAYIPLVKLVQAQLPVSGKEPDAVDSDL